MVLSNEMTTENTVACFFCCGTGSRKESDCNFCFATGAWTTAVAEFHWFNDLQTRLAASAVGATDYDTREFPPLKDIERVWTVWQLLAKIETRLRREQVDFHVYPSCAGVGCTQCCDRGYDFEINATV